MTEQHLRPHEWSEGETFEYLYEASESTFATEQVRDGRVPRLTDLLDIVESRTRLRFTAVSDDDRLRKQVEFFDMRFRTVVAADIEERRSVPYVPGSEHIPGLPEVVTYTYDIGGDGAVASDLHKVFGAHRDPIRFIDAFTFAATLENLSTSMSPGDVRKRRAIDVEFYGTTYHSHGPIQFFDRVELIDGAPHAYVKLHAPGNFTTRGDDDANHLASALIPLDGPAAGLVARGELQELVFGSAAGGAVQATQRQVSFTMQTDRTRSEPDPAETRGDP